jgi:4-hydroxy-2-oxoglutarate aldolase
VAVERLALHPNIVGMKESGGDMAYIADCIARTPPAFTMLAGSAASYFAALCTGCDGAILALAALVPDLCVRMRDLVLAQEIEAARHLQRMLAPLAKGVGAAHGVPGLKAALDLLGLAGGAPREPLALAPDAVVADLRKQLELLGRLPETDPRDESRGDVSSDER